MLIDGERDSDRRCVGLSRSRRADRRAARLDQHWQDVIVHTGHDKRAPPSRRDQLVTSVFRRDLLVRSAFQGCMIYFFDHAWGEKRKCPMPPEVFLKHSSKQYSGPQNVLCPQRGGKPFPPRPWLLESDAPFPMLPPVGGIAKSVANVACTTIADPTSAKIRRAPAMSPSSNPQNTFNRAFTRSTAVQPRQTGIASPNCCIIVVNNQEQSRYHRKPLLFPTFCGECFFRTLSESHHSREIRTTQRAQSFRT